MVSQEQIKEWKEKYGSIFKTTSGGKDYYFRLMDRPTYIEILTKQAMDPANFDNDLEVFKACVVSDYDEAELSKKAGILSVVSEKIMIMSGFEMSDVEEL